MSHKFLVVDDTTFMRKMAADCLHQYGHEVVGEATNGKEAIRLYNELQPDIVMMDLTMPEMNGIDAIKEILKINSDAVVLVCSASNQRDMIFEALDAGAKGYLMKPFKPDHMNEIIRKYAEPYLPSDEEIEELEGEGLEDIKEEKATVDSEAPLQETVDDDSVREAEDEDQEEIAATIEQQVVDETDDEPIHTESIQIDSQTNPTEDQPDELILHTHLIKGDDEDKERETRKMPNIENKIKFVTSYTCNWEEDIQGSNQNYSFTYTENDKNISIEMNNGTDDPQKVMLSLDGFRQLFGWLEGQLEQGRISR